ncbi:hypothetical protein [Microbacterium esteraromaticum]|uniref:hypothetical protein n=1 Tax=Microbacterium esteraromaticum TaxID=57043 RepID=UPI00117D7697|nr:hypothetical protein [Microbacterium esteraromaticum]
MTIRDPHGPAPEGVSAVLALVIGFASFAALAILGLGMLTFFADIDIIAVPGLDIWPGIVGMVIAIAVFSGMLWPVLVRERPHFPSVILVAIITVIAHVATVWVSALLSGATAVQASDAAAQLVTRGSSAVVLAAALVAAWIAVALRRTQANPPRWPWERNEEE